MIVLVCVSIAEEEEEEEGREDEEVGRVGGGSIGGSMNMLHCSLLLERL